MEKTSKQKVAIGLVTVALVFGAAKINQNIDESKFWDGLRNNRLYVTSFNKDEYLKVANILINEINSGNFNKMDLQSKKIYWLILNHEKPKKGWILHDVNQNNIVSKLNEALKESIK